MISFRYLVFKFFSIWESVKDCCKDVNNKGVLERFNEVIGKYLDDELQEKIDKLVDFNLYIPDLYLSMLPYLENRYNVDFRLYDEISWRKLVLIHILSWYKKKGLSTLYHTLFGMLGVDYLIDLHQTAFTLDSSITLDHDDRVFDSGCSACAKYELKLSGTAVLDADLENAIKGVVRFNKAVTADIISVTYNGNTITI